MIGAGFAITTAGFAVLVAVQPSWRYAAFVLPLAAVAAALALSNGPCLSLATSSVSTEQVVAASGISNMARYVGAAVMTSIIAVDALATAFAWSVVVLTLVSAAGIVLAVVAIRRPSFDRTTTDQITSATSSAHAMRCIPAPTAGES